MGFHGSRVVLSKGPYIYNSKQHSSSVETLRLHRTSRLRRGECEFIPYPLLTDPFHPHTNNFDIFKFLFCLLLMWFVSKPLTRKITTRLKNKVFGSPSLARTTDWATVAHPRRNCAGWKTRHLALRPPSHCTNKVFKIERPRLITSPSAKAALRLSHVWTRLQSHVAATRGIITICRHRNPNAVGPFYLL